jgi:hypothetical protein
MISLAESLLETDGREDLSSVLDSLKTYDKYLEKGPFGLEYCLLRKKLAEKDGEDPAPFTERGRRLARLMIESEMDEEVREALMKLPAFAKFGAGT